MGRATHKREGSGRVDSCWERIDQARDRRCILSPKRVDEELVVKPCVFENRGKSRGCQWYFLCEHNTIAIETVQENAS